MPDEGGQDPHVFVYKDKRYDALFTRTLGWNGGDGVLTTALPRRQRLLVLQRQFLRRRGRRNPRPGRMQLPAQQPHDPERRDDRLGDRNRRRPGMAGRLRADDRSLGRPLLPGPHAYPPPESLALRRGDRERRDRPGFLLLGRRRGHLRRSGSRKDPADALDGRGTRRTEEHRRLPAGVFARRRARRRHLHVSTLDRLRLQGRRAGLRLDHVRGHEGRAHLSLHDQAGGARSRACWWPAPRRSTWAARGATTSAT